MEKRHLKAPVLVAIAALVLSGCGGLGRMNRYAENIRYTVDPNPLIVQGDSVAININGNFPGKYFHRRALVELTPTLVYTGGETPAKTAYFQGDKATGNHTVVPYEGGKAFTYNHKVAYTPAMAESELMVRIVGRQGNKERTFDDVKIADGVMTTPFLVQPDDRVLLGRDQFQRITNHTQEAVIHYLVNSSVVRPGELNDQDVREMANFIRGFAKRGNINLQGMSIDAWASPEGELSLNENLARDRARSAQGWSRGEFTRARVEAARNDAFFQLNPRGEDWEGFKREMQQSNVADRDLVLRVLEMYPDVSKREAEIRNMAATYREIAEEILPRLRRSEMRLNYEIVGKTDEQITDLSRNNPDSLNAEELLFAATLTTDLNEQMRIYREAERIHPQDYRGANNVGYVYMMQNRIDDAQASFEKANSIKDNPVSTNNLGVIARLKGDKRRAAELYGKAMEAGPEVKYNMGIVNIQQGDYGAANNNMTGQNTHNAALAKLLSGDPAGAQRILEQGPDKDTAHGHYLMAIIAARQNNGDQVRSHLGQAVQKDESLREKAMKDLEFRQFKGQLGI
jgi:tetratricopeptide (TPR) repeat protein